MPPPPKSSMIIVPFFVMCTTPNRSRLEMSGVNGDNWSEMYPDVAISCSTEFAQENTNSFEPLILTSTMVTPPVAVVSRLFGRVCVLSQPWLGSSAQGTGSSM